METNPNEPPQEPLREVVEDDRPDRPASPVVVYTAGSNIEAHSLVTWLESNGIQGHAVEDNSGVSLFALGTISQFHDPQVFVDKQDHARAVELVEKFETRRVQRRENGDGDEPVSSECEECGKSSEFPASEDGTTQNCPKCGAYMDVGEMGWPDDFDFGEENEDGDDTPKAPADVDQAVDAAFKLETEGEWDAAIAAFQMVADRWPEHSEYVENCIADVKRKLDSTK